MAQAASLQSVMAFVTKAEERLSSATHSAQFQAALAYIRSAPQFKTLQRMIQTNPLLAQAVAIAAPTLMQTDVTQPNAPRNNGRTNSANSRNGRLNNNGRTNSANSRNGRLNNNGRSNNANSRNTRLNNDGRSNNGRLNNTPKYLPMYSSTPSLADWL